MRLSNIIKLICKKIYYKSFRCFLENFECKTLNTQMFRSKFKDIFIHIIKKFTYCYIIRIEEIKGEKLRKRKLNTIEMIISSHQSVSNSQQVRKYYNNILLKKKSTFSLRIFIIYFCFHNIILNHRSRNANLNF